MAGELLYHIRGFEIGIGFVTFKGASNDNCSYKKKNRNDATAAWRKQGRGFYY